MPTAKDEMIEIIKQQPEDSNYDELLRELAFKKLWIQGWTMPDTVAPSRMRKWDGEFVLGTNSLDGGSDPMCPGLLVEPRDKCAR